MRQRGVHAFCRLGAPNALASTRNVHFGAPRRFGGDARRAIGVSSEDRDTLLGKQSSSNMMVWSQSFSSTRNSWTFDNSRKKGTQKAAGAAAFNAPKRSETATRRNDLESRYKKKRDPKGPPTKICSRVLSIDSIRKTTAGGRINRFRAIVCAGNMNGAGGFGIAKGYTVKEATQKALKKAQKNWIVIDLTEDNGIYHDVIGKFNNTKVMMRANRPYSGTRAGRIVQGILDVMGVRTCVTRVFGKGATSSVVFATFNGFGRLVSPDEVSETRGKRVIPQPLL